MTDFHEGGCLCGVVRYRVKGTPRAVIVCHCTQCQRSSGSAFSFTAVVPKPRLEFNDELLSTYDFRSADHGRSLVRKFCPRCGTAIVVGLGRVPNDWFVPAGTLDDRSWLTVTAHTYTRSAVEWMAFPPRARCFSENVWDEQNTPVSPLPDRDRPFLKGELFP